MCLSAFFFQERGKKITVCLNKCDTSVTYVSWWLLLPAYPFRLTLSPSGYLSQLGLTPSHSKKKKKTFDLFSLHFCPRWLYSYCPYTQPTRDRLLGQSPLCWISLCGTYSLLCPTPRHKLHCVQFLLRTICIFLFIRSACKIEFVLSGKGPQLLLVGEGGTHRKAAELQCTMLWTCKILFTGLNL